MAKPLKIKYKDKKYKVLAPMDWGEVSYTTYLNMTKCEDVDDLFLSSLNLPEEIKEVSNITDLYTYCIDSKVYNTQPDFDYHDDYRLALDVLLPQKVTNKSIAQYEDCKHLLSTCYNKDGQLNNIKYNNILGQVFAIYLQGEKDGKYNYDKSQELLDQVNELPCEQVISTASFFLNKLFKKKKFSLNPYHLIKWMKGEKELGILN